MCVCVYDECVRVCVCVCVCVWLVCVVSVYVCVCSVRACVLACVHYVCVYVFVCVCVDRVFVYKEIELSELLTDKLQENNILKKIAQPTTWDLSCKLLVLCVCVCSCCVVLPLESLKLLEQSNTKLKHVVGNSRTHMTVARALPPVLAYISAYICFLEIVFPKRL